MESDYIYKGETLMKKNLVLLIPSLKRGGAERVVSRLSSLLKKEYNINIVIFDSSQIDYECDAPIFDLEEKADSNSLFVKFTKIIRRAYKYYKFKRSNNVDITYSFGNSANFINIFSFGSDVKITSVRGFGNLSLTSNSILNYFYRLLVQLTLSKSDRIVSVSKVIKYNLIDRFKIEGNKIKVIYNGYDVEEIQKKCVKEKPKSTYFRFVSMGTYRKEKNYPRLLDSFLEVSKQHKDVKLIILGEGNEVETNKMLDYIERNNLKDKVELLGFKKNPYEIISSCDCYILPSLSEGFPNALVEAMACGLPVIATDCETGPKEILSKEEKLTKRTRYIDYTDFGVLVSATYKKNGQTVDPLTEAMIKMKENADLRRNYSSLSLKRASYFSYEQWKEEHISLLG